MIYKECKHYLIWLLILSIGFSIINLLYFKTICLSLLINRNGILEFSYDNGFSLLNLEIFIFMLVFSIQFLWVSSLLLYSFGIPGLFYFEMKIIFQWILLNRFIFMLHFLIFYEFVERVLFYSHINSSSNIILLNPNIIRFIKIKFKFHITTYLFLVLSLLLLGKVSLYISIMILKKEILIILIIHTLIKKSRNYHANLPI